MVKKKTATKTVKEWLGEATDKKFRALLLERYDEDFCQSGRVVETFTDAIFGAFDWEETAEGDLYWRKIANKTRPIDHVFMEAEDKTNPSHYKTLSGLEAIDVIEAFGLGFCLGNACKYLLRAGKKGGEATIHDLEKLKWYVDREISNMNKK